MRRMWLWPGALVCAMILVAGCGSGADRDPYVRRARDLRQRQMIDEAIVVYNKALDRRPNYGTVHMELGVLYDEYKEDYVLAIYHYERFLALEPKSERREMVRDLIRQARMSFAASLPDRPNEAVREVAFLKQEIVSLRASLSNTVAELNRIRAAGGRAAPAGTGGAKPVAAGTPTGATAAASASAAPAAGSAAPTGGAAVASGGAPAVYVVQPGDSLRRIAGKVYGDPGQWEKIWAANRDKLPTPESVRAGQKLDIPPPRGGR